MEIDLIQQRLDELKRRWNKGDSIYSDDLDNDVKQYDLEYTKLNTALTKYETFITQNSAQLSTNSILSSTGQDGELKLIESIRSSSMTEKDHYGDIWKEMITESVTSYG